MDGARKRPPVLAACGMAFEAALAAGPGVVPVYGWGAGQECGQEFGLERGSGCRPGTALPAQRLANRSPERPADRLADRLANRLDALLRDGAAGWSGILSFGCAGALDPGLAAGSCVLATGVHTPDGFLCADADWLRALGQRLPHAIVGELAGSDAPLLTAAAKAALWRASGACAVDMESHAAALAARRHGLPFAACRVVLDPAWRSVPPCALAGMGADGSTAFLPLLRALVAAPGQLGGLCLLAGDAWRARHALARVRVRLGPRMALPASFT